MSDLGPNGGTRRTLAERVRALQLNDVQPQRTSGSWVPWLLCLIFAGLSIYFAYQAYFAAEPEPPPTPTQQLKTYSPTGAAPAAQVASSGEVVHESRGHIVPAHKIQVSPKVAGMVTKLNFDVGMVVEKGTVLAELEKVDYLADVNRAAAAAAAAKARYEELARGMRPEEKKRATAALEEARAVKREVEDQLKRLRASGRAATEEELTRTELRLAQAIQRVIQLEQEEKMMLEGARIERIEAAKAEWQAAEAELAKAQWRLDNCTIRAPVTGIILSKKAEEGDIVNPVAFNVSASLCEMADLSDLEVELKIQERDIAKIFVGQRCRIRPEAYPDRLYEGYVDKIIPAADRGIGAVPVRVKVERLIAPKSEAAPDLRAEQGKYLLPDMAAVTAFLRKQPVEEAKPPEANGKTAS
ncbi:MAG: efflux RND transporter periplasmic adaptor subunit [Gemmatales bacterium]|nr:efflux RND transporter periplasmic adaptor subunit [Gemmatales bacterium]MDW8387808.1 efflux RND transporter periplasmic adaptor subunit [Gemmatales bacterium]